MFNSGNCGVPITRNVEPANSGNNNSNGWGGDGAWLIWIVRIFQLIILRLIKYFGIDCTE